MAPGQIQAYISAASDDLLLRRQLANSKLTRLHVLGPLNPPEFDASLDDPILDASRSIFSHVRQVMASRSGDGNSSSKVRERINAVQAMLQEEKKKPPSSTSA